MTTDVSHPSRVEGLRVLVVEDSYFVAVALGKQLRQLGCRVVGPAPTVAPAVAPSSPPVDPAAPDVTTTPPGIIREGDITFRDLKEFF